MAKPRGGRKAGTSSKPDGTPKRARFNLCADGQEAPSHLQQSPDPPPGEAAVKDKPVLDNVGSLGFERSEVTIVNYSKANLQSEAHSFKNGVCEVVWPRVQFLGHSKDLILLPAENACLARLIATNCSVPEKYIEPWWERNMRSVNCILGVKRSNARQKFLVSYFSTYKFETKSVVALQYICTNRIIVIISNRGYARKYERS